MPLKPTRLPAEEERFEVRFTMRDGEGEIDCYVDESAIEAATASAGEGTNPPSDTNGDAAFRRHLAGVLTSRAVCTAGGVVRGPSSASAGAA